VGIQGYAEAAEVVEGRGLAKGNLGGCNRDRTQCRDTLQQALDRVRQAARRVRLLLTALWHHVYDIDRLREAYYSVNRRAAPGVDGETWAAYGGELEANLRDLSGRLERGAYHAQPVERVYIPKPDGRERPIGIPTLEDKMVQRATVEVLNAVYEGGFLGFSYGFRPGRCIGCGDGRDREAQYQLGARCRHPWILRYAGPRMVSEIHRASDRGPARGASHPEVAECRYIRGWAMARSGGRDSPRREREPVAREHLPPLRL
jgi:hypothetical protein